MSGVGDTVFFVLTSDVGARRDLIAARKAMEVG